VRKGLVRVSNKLISDFFGFPPDWEILRIEPGKSGESLMEIYGSDFPESQPGEASELVELVCHKEHTTYEVKRLK